MARRLFLAATMALVLSHAEGFAIAQDPAPDPPEVMIVDDGFDPDHVTPLENPVELPEGFFERYFLGDVAKFEHWHEKMDRLFESQMRLAGKDSKFSANEERKLRLAAKGDIKHLADELAVARNRVEEASADLHGLNALLQSYRPLRLKALSGPFRSDSLFQKTLEGIRRKRREEASRGDAMLRGLLATLNIALIAVKEQEPFPAKPKSLRELIDDASRIPTIRHMEENARRKAQERFERDEQLRLQIELAMPPEKPEDIDPLTAIDDFEREPPAASASEPPLETMPEGFIDRYFLGMPRDSSGFASRVRRFLLAQMEACESILELSAADKEKLRLAAQGDLKRLDDELAAARQRLEQAWPDHNARMLALASLEELRTRARSNPFQGHSFVGKTLRKIAREKGVRLGKPAANGPGSIDAHHLS